MFVLQVFGKTSGKFHDIRLSHGINDVYALLIREIVVKLTDSIQITVDGLRPQSLAQQLVNIFCNFPICDVFYGYVEPENKVFQTTKIILNGIG